MRPAVLFLALAVPAFAPTGAADQPFADVGLALPWQCVAGPGCENPSCARVAGAWTSATQPRVDIYVSKVLKEKLDPTDPDDVVALVEEVRERAREYVEDLADEPPMGPGPVNGGPVVVQVDVTVPGAAGAEGVRLTFEVDVLGCLGQ